MYSSCGISWFNVSSYHDPFLHIDDGCGGKQEGEFDVSTQTDTRPDLIDSYSLHSYALLHLDQLLGDLDNHMALHSSSDFLSHSKINRSDWFLLFSSTPGGSLSLPQYSCLSPANLFLVYMVTFPLFNACHVPSLFAMTTRLRGLLVAVQVIILDVLILYLLCP